MLIMLPAVLLLTGAGPPLRPRRVLGGRGWGAARGSPIAGLLGKLT
jgi:hypothetical protein